MRSAVLALVVLGLHVVVPPPAAARPRAAAPERSATARDDARCLALAVYWEARAEGRRGMVPVAWVVLNRSQHPAFPRSICAVVQDGGERAPCQFSFWCDGQPDDPEHTESWALARTVAQEMLTAPPRDPTRGALYFHAVTVAPAWAKEKVRTARIGRHVYYR